MEKLNYIIKRVLLMIPVLFVTIIVVFSLVRFLPGDTATAMLGDKVDPAVLEQYREEMGLNDSIFVQFGIYLKDLLHLDLGESLQYNMPVAELIQSRLGVTVLLTLSSTLLTILISLPLGYWAGMKKDKLPDHTIRTFALLGLSIPSFWIALMLLMFFGVKLHWFPVSGWGYTTFDHFKALCLPAITQALGATAVIVRNLRNNVVDVKTQDYVDFARCKGLSRLRVGTLHILRNAMIPTSTLLSMRIISMLGGSVIIENVFTLPGMGELLVTAVNRRDYAVVQGVVLVFVLVVLAINLITDILYSVLDPRITLK